MKDPNLVRIGCFGGFWGDSMAMAVNQFLRSPQAQDLDYLVSDYLAEVTMCILAKKAAKAKKDAAAAGKSSSSPSSPSSPNAMLDAAIAQGGFIDDFATQIWQPFGKILMDKNIKVVVNAGGLNPKGLKALIDKASEKQFPDPSQRPVVAAVWGDDLTPQAAQLAAAGKFRPFQVDGGDENATDAFDKPSPWGSRDATSEVDPKKLLSCNAYVGAQGIVEALQAGAHIVVTGRVVDSAMVLAPLIYEHRWSMENYDLLAQGTLAGHVIECGAQCTGGNFTDWELGLKMRGVGGRLFENMGFPVVEVSKDGSFVVTKPSGTAGIVSRLSVLEQIVYEIGDPKCYRVADVGCDFTSVEVEEIEPNRVRVVGAKGVAPSGCYKVTATFASGFIGTIVFPIVGVHAAPKARAITESIIRRANKTLQRMDAPPYTDIRTELYGAGTMYNDGLESAIRNDDAREVVVRLTAHHPNPKALGLLAMHMPSSSTGMSPGVFMLQAGRSPVAAAVAMRSALIPAEIVRVRVTSGLPWTTRIIDGLFRGEEGAPPIKASTGTGKIDKTPAQTDNLVEASLIHLACCRSGDKGDAANVGVVARHSKYFEHLKAHVTEERVREHLRQWFNDNPRKKGSVTRHILPGPRAMNFVLTAVLGGGGILSLKGDKQGKSIGGILLDMKIPMPKEWVMEYQEGVGAKKAAIRSKL